MNHVLQHLKTSWGCSALEVALNTTSNAPSVGKQPILKKVYLVEVCLNVMGQVTEARHSCLREWEVREVDVEVAKPIT